MSSATEAFDSHEGRTRGLNAVAARRSFSAVIDAEDADPILPVETVLPLGSVHPHDSALTLTDYVIVDRTGPFSYRVDAIYQSEASRPFSFDNWRTSVQFNAQTERLNRSLPVADGETHFSLVGPLPGKQIGPRIYRPIEKLEGSDEFETATHQAWDLTRKKDNYKVHLVHIVSPEPKDPPVRPAPIDVLDASVSLIFSQRLRKMTMDMIRAVAEQKTTVNSETFLTYPPHRLLFANFSMEESVGKIAEQDVDGFVFDVQLEFLFKKTPWSPVTKFTTYKDTKGFESVVRGASGPEEPLGAAVSDTFKIYQATDFQTILDVLETGSTTDIPKGNRSGRG